jgi:hypothetical protein
MNDLTTRLTRFGRNAVPIATRRRASLSRSDCLRFSLFDAVAGGQRESPRLNEPPK